MASTSTGFWQRNRASALNFRTKVWRAIFFGRTNPNLLSLNFRVILCLEWQRALRTICSSLIFERLHWRNCISLNLTEFCSLLLPGIMQGWTQRDLVCLRTRERIILLLRIGLLHLPRRFYEKLNCRMTLNVLCHGIPMSWQLSFWHATLLLLSRNFTKWPIIPYSEPCVQTTVQGPNEDNQEDRNRRYNARRRDIRLSRQATWTWLCYHPFVLRDSVVLVWVLFPFVADLVVMLVFSGLDFSF